jgi:hypothetical protein
MEESQGEKLSEARLDPAADLEPSRARRGTLRSKVPTLEALIDGPALRTGPSVAPEVARVEMRPAGGVPPVCLQDLFAVKKLSKNLLRRQKPLLLFALRFPWIRDSVFSAGPITDPDEGRD